MNLMTTKIGRCAIPRPTPSDRLGERGVAFDMLNVEITIPKGTTLVDDWIDVSTVDATTVTVTLKSNMLQVKFAAPLLIDALGIGIDGFYWSGFDVRFGDPSSRIPRIFNMVGIYLSWSRPAQLADAQMSEKLQSFVNAVIFKYLQGTGFDDPKYNPLDDADPESKIERLKNNIGVKSSNGSSGSSLNLDFVGSTTARLSVRLTQPRSIKKGDVEARVAANSIVTLELRTNQSPETIRRWFAAEEAPPKVDSFAGNFAAPSAVWWTARSSAAAPRLESVALSAPLTVSNQGEELVVIHKATLCWGGKLEVDRRDLTFLNTARKVDDVDLLGERVATAAVNVAGVIADILTGSTPKARIETTPTQGSVLPAKVNDIVRNDVQPAVLNALIELVADNQRQIRKILPGFGLYESLGIQHPSIAR